jgi:hypothetical protein
VPILLVPSTTNQKGIQSPTKNTEGQDALGRTEVSGVDTRRLAALAIVPENQGTSALPAGSKHFRINRDRSPGPTKLPSNYKTDIQIQPTSGHGIKGVNHKDNGKSSGNLTGDRSRDVENENGQKTDERSQDDRRMEVEEGMYLKSKLWWLGLVLMAVGEGGNFLSYGFAPASVVAPLGTVVSFPSSCLLLFLVQSQTTH